MESIKKGGKHPAVILSLKSFVVDADRFDCTVFVCEVVGVTCLSLLVRVELF